MKCVCVSEGRIAKETWEMKSNCWRERKRKVNVWIRDILQLYNLKQSLFTSHKYLDNFFAYLLASPISIWILPAPGDRNLLQLLVNNFLCFCGDSAVFIYTTLLAYYNFNNPIQNRDRKLGTPLWRERNKQLIPSLFIYFNMNFSNRQY